MLKIILIIIGTFLLLNVVARVIIYRLKFHHEKIKRRCRVYNFRFFKLKFTVNLTKYKWHVERLHEIYIKKEDIIKGRV